MKVIWTPLAQEEYADILQYIDNKFGLDTTLQFLEKAEVTIQRIQEFPKLFPISRKSKIVRKTTLFGVVFLKSYPQFECIYL